MGTTPRQRARAYLKHSQQQMLFAALVLISVDREHDCLQQRIDLRHRNQSAEVGDMPGFGLQEEEEVAVFLCLVVVRERAFLHLRRIFQMTSDFVLLQNEY